MRVATISLEGVERKFDKHKYDEYVEYVRHSYAYICTIYCKVFLDEMSLNIITMLFILCELHSSVL